MKLFRLLVVLILSLMIMSVIEISVFLKQLKPIRVALKECEPALYDCIATAK